MTNADVRSVTWRTLAFACTINHVIDFCMHVCVQKARTRLHTIESVWHLHTQEPVCDFLWFSWIPSGCVCVYIIFKYNTYNNIIYNICNIRMHNIYTYTFSLWAGCLCGSGGSISQRTTAFAACVTSAGLSPVCVCVCVCVCVFVWPLQVCRPFR